MNDILSSIGLGGGLTGGYWDQADAAALASGGLSNTTPAPAAASAGTSGFWASLGSNVNGLLNFAKQAAPVAVLPSPRRRVR